MGAPGTSGLYHGFLVLLDKPVQSTIFNIKPNICLKTKLIQPRYCGSHKKRVVKKYIYANGMCTLHLGSLSSVGFNSFPHFSH